MNTRENRLLLTISHILVFILGVIANFSGFIDSITNIPRSYSEFKKEFIYTPGFLDGNWSNNTEYVINGRDFGLEEHQVNIAFELSESDNGAASGQFHLRDLCKYSPLTDLYIIESEKPGFFNLFFDRQFHIKKIAHGQKQTIATLRLVESNKDIGTIQFNVVNDHTYTLPKSFKIAKNLPAFDDDVIAMSEYCNDIHKNYILNMMNNKLKNQNSRD
ncbi:hypothetical protein K6U20_11970 [Vibrio fluvialis]|uniref:hypothetical protein n=1 Tax=Vibrio fluvialis TaxID=676 RepID=UPI001EEA321F|nr:hypothetical protein [Vibrio fluvialis]MCG6405340.1 hypothetical protein [Vibrio fluvialis]